MTVYNLTAIERTDGSPRPHDEDKLGKQFRIVSLKVGEPAVLSYVDDPTWTLWTPRVKSVMDIPVYNSYTNVLIVESKEVKYRFETEGDELNGH